MRQRQEYRFPGITFSKSTACETFFNENPLHEQEMFRKNKINSFVNINNVYQIKYVSRNVTYMWRHWQYVNKILCINIIYYIRNIKRSSSALGILCRIIIMLRPLCSFQEKILRSNIFLWRFITPVSKFKR